MRPMFVRPVPLEDRNPKEPEYKWATGCRVCMYVDFARSWEVAMLRHEAHLEIEGCSWTAEDERAVAELVIAEPPC